MNTQSHIDLAHSVGATYYSPPPMRSVRGMVFDFDQLDAFVTALTGPGTGTVSKEIIEAITAYGDARADGKIEEGAAALSRTIRLIRSALETGPQRF
ncbi:MAG: hypothetical protein EPN79_11160 [Burkholderiaceae bacterium]|nr:MAG: hypothetical protein EPN79_11160 [Burkholderiaceae bacterium]TBR76757.1 MAG: hypothetical protein EPN64_05915 [Burkholderiaceae bacterium]